MSERIEKINEQLKQYVGQIISQELELPSTSITTITKVKATSDMKLAKVFISVIPAKAGGSTLKNIKRKQSYIQKLLGKKITFKFTPKLFFVLDTQEEDAEHIEKILDTVAKKG
ncbi:MAG: 30S ribosome-binding factor RbfA [Patescibacteria group bacterium]|nr:30S ribosome-binding factor RbfA [Patescibacteria group bacterium]